MRPILQGAIKTRGEWEGVDDHPFKVHPILKCKELPKLILIKGGEVLQSAEAYPEFDSV